MAKVLHTKSMSEVITGSKSIHKTKLADMNLTKPFYYGNIFEFVERKKKEWIKEAVEDNDFNHHVEEDLKG